MPSRRAESGVREAEVLAALWASDHPLTPGEVAEAVGDGLAYNTVLTILIRLCDKGAVVRERAGRAHAYQPVLDSAGLAARQMRATLDRGGDRAAVLRRFIADLGAGDEAMLRHVLADLGERSMRIDEAEA